MLRMSVRLWAPALVAATAALGVVAVRRSEAGQYPRAIPSPVSERQWRSDVVADGAPVRFPGPGAELLGPAGVKEGPNGHAYVLDFGDRSVKEFGPGGALVRRYGKGRGRGDGETLNPTDFDVAPDGELWVLDPSQGRIQMFGPDGEPTRTLPMTVPAMRLFIQPDGGYLLLAPGERLFHRFTPDGKEAGSFGVLVRDQERRSLAIQGEMSLTPGGGVVFGPLRAGYLARFGPGGELAFYRETVAPLEYPPLNHFRNGGSTVKREFLQQLGVVSLTVHGDEVWVLTPGEYQGRRRGVIDAYALADGAYRYSFLSPQRNPAAIHAAGRHLYVMSDTVVTRWTLRR
jgi:hypothetical protein